MVGPRKVRPYMPGYGVAPPDEGPGPLEWSWAESAFAESRNYWVVTCWPDGRPHAMPVWGVWDENQFWFSSAKNSRKIKNLLDDPRCVVAAENATDPLVLQGTATLVGDASSLERFIALINAKYGTDYGTDMVDPASTATVKIAPASMFGLRQEDFSGSPTRWIFEYPVVSP